MPKPAAGILPAHRLFERVHCGPLSDALGCRPADGLAVPCADDGCQAGLVLGGADVDDVAHSEAVVFLCLCG